jgi:hypothetical protein
MTGLAGMPPTITLSIFFSGWPSEAADRKGGRRDEQANKVLYTDHSFRFILFDGFSHY